MTLSKSSNSSNPMIQGFIVLADEGYNLTQI